jgi:formylmethanofuran dehydrogenase subunit C
MSGLVLTLLKPPAQRVDMSPLSAKALAGRKLAEIAAIPLQCGNRTLRVDELFKVSGEPLGLPQESAITIRKSTARLDRIGYGMTAGTLEIEGDAGAYLGMAMTGGTLRVSGSAGPFAACVMAGGEIHIGGDAGDFLGAALPGDRVGMQGGFVSVAGDAGARAGDHLRRGMLLIAGNADAYCGSRMIAGTIVVLGKAGDFIGFGMKRGTILLARKPERLLATFNDCGSHDLQFLPLLAESAKDAGKPFAALSCFGKRVRRYAGDRGVAGLGEILIREP